MIGYTDRATRCSGSRSRTECSSTPAPSSGYMFCSAPIHTPIIPVRRSPKYFQVRESGPSGSDRLVRLVVELTVTCFTINLTTHVVHYFGARRTVFARLKSGHLTLLNGCRIVRSTVRHLLPTTRLAQEHEPQSRSRRIHPASPPSTAR